jgi:hypothetical protein
MFRSAGRTPAFQIWKRNWSAFPVNPNAGAYRLLTVRKRPRSRKESTALA